MPTIQTFQESKNQLPEAPPATDITPERFGKDAAALAQLGGEIGDFGAKLMETRKRAVESDAVSSAYTEAMLRFSAIDDEERATYQNEIANNPGKAVDISGTSEKTRARMEEVIQEQLKAMPTGDAQNAYMERIRPVASRFYLGSVDWENKTRANAIVGNMGNRANLVSQDLMRSPSLGKTVDHIKGLKDDILAKTGTVLDQEQAQKAQAVFGKQYTASLFDGLAAGTAADAEYGRQLLKNLPPELAEFTDAEDIRRYSARIDQADNERQRQQNIDKAAQKEALKVNQDKAQSAILSDIYAGKATIKDILHGKGSVMDPDKQQQMINVLEARMKEPKVANDENLRSVVERIYADPEDPRRIGSEDQIMNMYIKGRLTWDQKQKALNEFRGKYTTAGQIESEQKKQLYKQAAAVLVQKDIMGRPQGQEQMAQFWSYALTEIDNAKKAGTPVKELLDPSSSKYLGKSIVGYQKSPRDLLQQSASRYQGQAIQDQTKSVTVPQPKGTVLMVDPKGKQFYVPEGNVEKARARGFKKAGRSPQSVGIQFGADSFYQEDDIMKIMNNKKLSDQRREELLTDMIDELDAFAPKEDGSGMPESEYDRLQSLVGKQLDVVRARMPADESDENEDALKNMARGKTAEEELAIRARLEKAQRGARNATKVK